ncbi:PVC-type heme-binding CxxCH protein [Pareuzebyella sediminis]|uniref:PVC-type heme-binding CxxCH protein n=1 Tax=Pareuzebyella sediminis TaxID=2607998 RepID=UPI0018E1A85E|nr:PVC-type heme-binding CxxCH protein [Pareuzebyella sediminis]
MKKMKTDVLTVLCGTLFFMACTGTKQPPPPLTYSGDEPRVQDPLSPEDSQRHIQLPEGFSAHLFAAEPNIINPIAFTWDERGRLWVVQSKDYPHDLANDVGGDRITICEDTDGDGKADIFTDFATEQSLSTGIVLVKGGAIVSQAPEMVFLEDTDGDDKMDKRTVLFDGFGTFDTHAGPSSLRYGIDNALWGAVGYSGFENDFDGNPVKFERGVYRFGKDGSFLEPVGQFDNNTWGMGYNENFEIFGSTANNNHACYVGIPLKHYAYLEKRPEWALNADFIQGHYEISPVGTVPLQQVDVRGGYTAAAGANFYTARNYPEAYRNQMYVCEPTGHLVHIAKIVTDGAGYKEVDGGNIFASTDAWTAPVFAETGPDGNLWVADWYNAVIQHNPDKRGMENQIWNADKGEGNAHINPLRDYGHGRIYIVKYDDRDDSEITRLDRNDNEALLEALQSDNLFWRITAQRLIVEEHKEELRPNLLSLAVNGENTDGNGLNAPALHALWTLDGLGAFDGQNEVHETLVRGLESESFAVKRAAMALLPETTLGSETLVESGLLAHNNPQIRLAAIVRASELPESAGLYTEMEKVLADPDVISDKWLKSAAKMYFRELNYETIDEASVEMVIPSAQEGKSVWHYTENEPREDWTTAGFDDTAWETGEGMFGGKNIEEAKTQWTTKELWLRKEVQIGEAIDEPVLKIAHDDDYEIFINGQQLMAEAGSSGRVYKYIRLDKEKGKLFKTGKNVIAVRCVNTGGDQYVDVGIGKVGDVKADIVFDIKTVPQEMAFDKTVLRAKAGQTIEIRLENKDQMPHNLVVISPGTLDVFGPLVDKFVATPEAEKMDYVPKSRYVLKATTMLDPNESESIILTLPDEPGTYPFVCTFPGHWRFMQGEIIVTAPDSSDIEA